MIKFALSHSLLLPKEKLGDRGITFGIGKEKAHPEGVEPPTSRFVVLRSIQLSYGCARATVYDALVEKTQCLIITHAIESREPAVLQSAK